MDSGFARVDAIFQQAIQLPAGQRQAFLASACAGQPELLAQVEQLLAAGDAAPTVDMSATKEKDQRQGQVFGHYRIERLLGRGGMGAVYLAKRSDGEFEQIVALKILAAHLVEDQFAERFRSERQVLARLNHAHIVHLLDGGVSERGEPYLVTEYIDGQTLDRYCDQQRLAVKDRLRLFVQVLAAVEHAHQNLIVHRDLKPANILVTKGGEAKLLDFGTAKLLGEASEKTATESMLLTPRYASPEQLRNEPITTRSDVYSLGLILYEMLSGARPFASTGDAMGELARAYQYTSPTALGRTITPEAAAQRRSSVRELTRELAGDLRVITTKALEHEPAQRYGSAAELARDIEAYLASRPIAARPQQFLYVLRKFVERQKVGAAAAALLLIVVAVGVGTTVREKQVAERRFAQVRQLARYQLFDLYDQTEKLPNTTRLRAGMAQEAMRYLDGLAKESGSDESLRIELAEGYLRTGDVLGNYAKDNLGQFDQALQSYGKARALLNGLSSPAAERVRVHLDFTEANAKYAAGTSDNALAPLLKAVEQYEKLLAREPKNVQNSLRLGRAYMAVARALQMPAMGTEFGDRSREFTDKAKDAFDLGLSKDPENHDLIAALHSLAAGRAVWTAESKPQEALRWANEAAMWAARRKGEARSSDFLVAEANRLTGHAAAMAASGDPQAGLAEMNQVVKLLEELTQDADNRSAVMNLVASLSNRALLEYDLDRKDDYLATCERAFALTEAQRQQGNFPPAMERQRFRLLNYLSWAYVEKRDPRAGSFVEMAYKELAQKAKADPQNLPSRSYLCDILINLKPPGFDRPEEGLQYAEQMIAIAPKGFGGYESAAFALERLNRFAEAADTLKKALAMLDAPAPGQPPSKIYSTISARVANYEALADKMGAAQPAR